MIKALAAISSHRATTTMEPPHTTTTSHDIMNEILQRLLDENGFSSEEDDYFDDDGNVDDDMLQRSMEKQETADAREKMLLLRLMYLNELEEAVQKEKDAVGLRHRDEQFRAQRKRRRKGKRQWYVDPIDGKLRRVCPKLSSWWIDYIQNPEPNCPAWNKVFRQRFRLPYMSYLEILDWVSGDGCGGLFDRWRTESDGYTGRRNNKKVSPLELLLLGTLRYLGRGWTFDDIEESTKVSRDVHRCFFHAFTTFGAKFLYPRYVCMPQSTADLRNCESEYAVAGFPGCIGSTDATHIIPLNKVTASICQTQIGYNLGSDATTRTYNLAVWCIRRCVLFR
jgi:hypothetical protein